MILIVCHRRSCLSLIIFGRLNESGVLSSVECYDPERDRWQIVTEMATARDGLAAAELNGSIYVCGGYNASGPLSVCERYDHQKDQWETVASMNKGRGRFSLVAANGRLYAVGGRNSDQSVEMYDPERNEWTLLPNELIEHRAYCSAVAL